MKRKAATSAKAEPSASSLSSSPSSSSSAHTEFHTAVELLSNLHGYPERSGNVPPVLDALVRTILSQNTTDKTSRVAFENLKRHFPTWSSVLHAIPGTVEDSIRCGGLADVKANNVRAILSSVLAEFPEECSGGEPSLEFLRGWDTERIKSYLTAFKGVGPKTVSCVLMFNLHRDEFPVDTHVWHICQKLGWCSKAASRERCYEELASQVPAECKYPLHVLLVEHGKRCRRCCKGSLQLPEQGPCPLIGAWRERSSDVMGDSSADAAAAAGDDGETETVMKVTGKKRVMVKTEGCEMLTSDRGTGTARARGSPASTVTQTGAGAQAELTPPVGAAVSSAAPRRTKAAAAAAAALSPPLSSSTGRKRLKHWDLEGGSASGGGAAANECKDD